MGNKTALVIGASGFLGSHLVRELIKKEYKVRILVRANSNIQPISHLDFEKHIGDVGDTGSLVKAMQGCNYVFHSAVNTSAWLQDSGPLYETNVVGVMNSVRAAQQASIKKFVITSSLVTIGRNPNGISTEENILKPADMYTDYTKTRYYAEKVVLDAFIDSGFPGIACCVGNTYGEEDSLPTPHGNLVKQVVLGRLPIYFATSAECVGIVDAAQALILAAEKGRDGERYIISEKYISNKDIFTTAAKESGSRPPLFAFPRLPLTLITLIIESLSRLFNFESVLTCNSVNMMYETWPLSNEKAKKELGWEPRPVEEAIEEAAVYYKNNR